MTHRIKNKSTLPPGDPDRANPKFVDMVARKTWYEEECTNEWRHPEQKRNEVWLANVTATEFAFISSIKKRDFKSVRLGLVPYTRMGEVVERKDLRPMFGALRRGARLRRKENAKIHKKRRSPAKRTGA